ncbi:kallikrein-7-like [Cololabis saira]|uniref:kallikrein-7-like n=1 Tax=Cololabis saira TaxID=129043 RepID=UPI002AD2D93C|nr:kallikrein-7-like [Cololabis saira]XP_061576170.1 kallikrein-7-like [Cololabis saira]
MKTCVVLALFLMAGVSLADILKRIIGGRRCTPQEEQHYVFLETTDPTGAGFICSGSVIGRGRTGLWVLTAAHCDEGGPSFTVKSADRSVTQTVGRPQTFQHPTADVMLLRLSQPMTPIRLATDAECTALRNRLNAKKPETFRITARDTQARADYFKYGGGVNPDVTMCASIIVKTLGPFNGVVVHTNQVSQNECCRGLPTPGCKTCGGDSGSGYISINALYAVHGGIGEKNLTNGMIIPNFRDADGFTICDTNIRQWIDQTMMAHP